MKTMDSAIEGDALADGETESELEDDGEIEAEGETDKELEDDGL